MLLKKLTSNENLLLSTHASLILGISRDMRREFGKMAANTHAAIWAGMAFAALGDKTSAWRLMHMLNPINHSLTVDNAEKYKIAPYVVTADVYASIKHAGRGGWSWYTGSASWMYRFLIEPLLGIERSASSLKITPCLPAAWSGIKIRLLRHNL